MDRIRDRLWIWGHPPGAHNIGWGFQKTSRMTAAECAYYLGARNICMVCFGNNPKPPFDQECMAMEPMKEVIWSIVGDASSSSNLETLGHLEEIIRIAGKFDNVNGAIFDDFFSEERLKEYTPEVLANVRDRLHNNEFRHLDMWVVLYDNQLDTDVQKHIDEFDGVTFWTWKGSDLANFDQNFEKFYKLTQAKRRLLGCYLYNYGETTQFNSEDMEFQLNRYADCIRSGKAEGIILLSNTVADLGFEAVEYTKHWIAEHGDEMI